MPRRRKTAERAETAEAAAPEFAAEAPAPTDCVFGCFSLPTDVDRKGVIAGLISQSLQESGQLLEDSQAGAEDPECERCRQRASERSRLLWQRAIATVVAQNSRAKRSSLQLKLSRVEDMLRRSLDCSEKDRLAGELKERDSLVKKLKEEKAHFEEMLREHVDAALSSTSDRRRSLRTICEAGRQRGGASGGGEDEHFVLPMTPEQSWMVHLSSMDSEDTGRYSIVSMPPATAPEALQLRIDEQSARIAELRLYTRELEEQLLDASVDEAELAALRTHIVKLESRQRAALSNLPAQSWWQGFCLAGREPDRDVPVAISLAGAAAEAAVGR